MSWDFQGSVTSLCSLHMKLMLVCSQVLNQVGILLRELCRLHCIPEPPDIALLTMPAAAGYRLPDRLEEDRDMEDEDDEEEEEGEEDLHLEMDEGENIAKSKVRCTIFIIHQNNG